MTRPTTTVEHPLDPLTAAEVTATREVLVEAGDLSERTRCPLMEVVEPGKEVVLAHRDGDPVSRRVAVVLLDAETGQVTEIEVNPIDRAIVHRRRVPTDEHPYGQPPILPEEYGLCSEIVKDDPEWQQAMTRRGITDREHVFVAPLSAGFFGFPEESGRRILRSLSFLRHDAEDSPWAHPIEGLVAYVDLIQRRVIQVVDGPAVPVPAECGNYSERAVGPPRTSLKPLEITQPEGPSFTVDGWQVRWENWRMRLSFNAREGLVLHTVGFDDGERERSVLHRASVAEMVVPYGDPSPSRFWISYFDAGEYLLGANANSLRLGCDCLGEIRYFDAVLADGEGRPYRVPNAICMHEEDHGVLWKHTDILTGQREVRRSRRLVVSFFVTVGNYDYGFYWYFYLDGTIELEVKATGIVFTGAIEPGETIAHGTEIAPGLMAPYHQHLFCARLDVAVDGPRNTVYEVDAQPVPMGPENPFGNAFTIRETALRRESEAGRLADSSVGRTWKVVNPNEHNRLGRSVSYQLVPKPGPPLLADPESSVAGRAAFASRHLWVTHYDREQRYPAGNYPNQHAGGSGIPEWIRADRSIDDTDLVLWHVFGPTHVPRTEDWPVMPVDYAGFSFRPVGFFARNPALDLPEGGDGHCSGAAAQ